MAQLEHFILAPDRAAARRLRRLLAEAQSRSHVLVGTWPELLETARGHYLLPLVENAWSGLLAEAAGAMGDGFWASSLEVAPEETLASLGQALQKLIEGGGPEGELRPAAEGLLPPRCGRHLCDLARLHEAVGRALPAELELTRQLLEADGALAIRPLRVCHLEGFPPLNPWQRALVSKLNGDAGGDPDPELEALQRQALDGWGRLASSPALKTLRTGLFRAQTGKIPLDESVQWWAARDLLEEVEVAAGAVQRLLRDDPSLQPAEIGLLLPADRGYARALREVFSRAGLPLSGLDGELPVRDLGREAVFNLLLCLRRPAPSMALCSLLTSPLMPWDAADGHDWAQLVMRGNYSLETQGRQRARTEQALRLLRQGVVGAHELQAALKVFSEALVDSGGLEEHLARAQAAIGALRTRLQGAREIPWEELLRLAAPEALTTSAEAELTREGVAVFAEHQEPWRAVRRLIVLGFSDGRYPAGPALSPVFSEADLEALREHLGLELETGAEAVARRRELLRRQLGAASEALTFLTPRRDLFGKALQPCASLPFLAQLFEGVEDPEGLIIDLDSAQERSRARGLALAEDSAPVPPRALEIADLHLRRDLTRLVLEEDGTPRPQSPSSLETLLTSPLGWLLDRAGLEPREWEPESFDVKIKGTLAHKVFEDLFVPGAPLPDALAVRTQVPSLFHQAMLQIAPFLLAAEWRVERRHLEREIEVAALRWRELLEAIGARVLGTEVWLTGYLDLLPIRGSADLLLALPDGRLYVVDYKKSKSDKRRKRMRAGYDSQASLYRIMLETGGASNRRGEDLSRALEGATEIGVLYYLMNDQTALADSAGWVGQKVAGVEELGAGISTAAMALTRQRLVQVRRGEVQLNRAGEKEWYDKHAGISLFALEASPLIRLFMHPAEEDSK